MLLAAGHVLGPVARVGLLVVKQTADTELFGMRAVPAGPVSGARCLVAEDAVQPVTVFVGDGWVCGREDKILSGQAKDGGRQCRDGGPNNRHGCVLY